MVPHAPYSRSTLFDAVKTLAQQEQVSKHGKDAWGLTDIGLAAAQ